MIEKNGILREPLVLQSVIVNTVFRQPFGLAGIAVKKPKVFGLL